MRRDVERRRDDEAQAALGAIVTLIAGCIADAGADGVIRHAFFVPVRWAKRFHLGTHMTGAGRFTPVPKHRHIADSRTDTFPGK
jgi:hypothetical protein